MIFLRSSRVRKPAWFITATILGLVAFLAFFNPERTARSALVELINLNFNPEAAVKAKVVGCQKKSFADRFRLRVPTPCVVSTACNREIEILVWVLPIGLGSVGPDSFASQVARVCASGLKKEIQKELESKLDVGG